MQVDNPLLSHCMVAPLWCWRVARQEERLRSVLSGRLEHSEVRTFMGLVKTGCVCRRDGLTCRDGWPHCLSTQQHGRMRSTNGS